MPSCLRCNKPLKLQASILRGMGAICAAKADRDAQGKSDETDSFVDLPFDPTTKNIVCAMDADGKRHFNIHQSVVYHSPTGMSWGYLGSGCADFALNIVELFMREFERPTVEMKQGVRICPSTQKLYQRFKEQFVSRLDFKTGGTIDGGAIQSWIETNRNSVPNF